MRVWRRPGLSMSLRVRGRVRVMCFVVSGGHKGCCVWVRVSLSLSVDLMS